MSPFGVSLVETGSSLDALIDMMFTVPTVIAQALRSSSLSLSAWSSQESPSCMGTGCDNGVMVCVEVYGNVNFLGCCEKDEVT